MNSTAEPLIIATLAGFHIFFGVGWLGSDLLVGFVLGPYATKLSPAAQSEFLNGVAPKILGFLEIVGGLTLLFGPLLLLAGETRALC